VIAMSAAAITKCDGTFDADVAEQTPLIGIGQTKSHASFVEVALNEVDCQVEDNDPVELPAADLQSGDFGIVTQHERLKRPTASFVLRADVESSAERAAPGVKRYLVSASGVLAQVLLCAVTIGINIYETVFKAEVKVSGAVIDNASANINQNILSVVLCLIVAASRGQLNLIFNKDTVNNLFLFFPVGCAFSLTSYLQIVIFGFIPSDVFKVLEQSRLLVTAILSLGVFGRRQSLASWNALVAISFAAVIYGQIQKMEQDMNGKGSGSSTANNYAVGLLLTVFFVITQCGAAIYSEALMKSSHHTPFYVQKFFLETSSVPFSIFTSVFLNGKLKELLERMGFDARGLESKVNYFQDGPFAGWNHTVVIFFAFFVLKSWCSGLLTKQMSSLAKQLCSVTSVGLVYFFLKIHGINPSFCPGMTSMSFCPANLLTATVPMLVADASVLCTVLSYTFAQRDAGRTAALRKEMLALESKGEKAAEKIVLPSAAERVV
jgi:hypothetical protein